MRGVRTAAAGVFVDVVPQKWVFANAAILFWRCCFFVQMVFCLHVMALS